MNKIAYFFGSMLLFILAACSNRTADPSNTPPPEPQVGLAEIVAIEVLPTAQGAAQQRILIQGNLPSSCTILDEVAAERNDRIFSLTASYSQASGVDCINTPVKFDKVFELGIEGLDSGIYTVQSGNASATFNLSASIAELEPKAEGPALEPQPAESPASPTAEPPTAPAVVPVTSDCVNKAAFYADVTIPDGTAFTQGEKFTKIWRIRNEGTCTINPDYSLVFAAGDPLDGPLSSPMPAIAPGQTADISIDLAAPNQGGKYGANYEFRDPNGNRFGVNSNGIDYIWVEIVVNWGVSQAGTTETTTSAVVPVPSNCSFSENSGYLDTILNLVNAARSAEGAAPLAANSALMAAAKVHSIDMGCNNFLDHTGSDGSKARTRVIAQGYNPSYAAENIYAGATEYGADAQGAFNWWMNSPVHRKNILNPRPTEVGVGFVNVPGSSFGGYYTMVFAAQ